MQSSLIAKHYSADVEYFTKFIDSPMMLYSCNVWDEDGTVEQSEINKAERFAKMLELKESDKVYEFGCGFGGEAGYLHDKYKADITGFNISPHWIQYAKDNYSAKYEVKDLYDVEGRVDKIYTDGVLVHHDHRKVFEKCSQLLDTGGIMVHKELYREGNWSTEQCQKLNGTFDNTGSYNKLEDDIRVLEALGFENEVIEENITSYVSTSGEWVKKMVQHKDELIAMVGEKKYYADLFMMLDFHPVFSDRLLTCYFIKSKKL